MTFLLSIAALLTGTGIASSDEVIATGTTEFTVTHDPLPIAPATDPNFLVGPNGELVLQNPDGSLTYNPHEPALPPGFIYGPNGKPTFIPGLIPPANGRDPYAETNPGFMAWLQEQGGIPDDYIDPTLEPQDLTWYVDSDVATAEPAPVELETAEPELEPEAPQPSPGLASMFGSGSANTGSAGF
ncbi:hypothetical protein AB0N05_02670 [Nocardia sp. NPDC051030]|uniref:hypothetical protein n=1 Tax=Nocardia sp. NPDC051030 TaxID=3155162 RepID=UPI00343F2283